MHAKQNLTVSLSRDIVRKAKVLAAERGTSVSRLVAELIEQMVGQEEAYQAAQRRALALLERGYRLGGTIRATREEWHER